LWKAFPFVENLTHSWKTFFIQRKGRMAWFSKPGNTKIRIRTYDCVLLQNPEKIVIRRFKCYRIRRYTMTFKDSFNSLKHCSRRFWKYPYSEVSGLLGGDSLWNAHKSLASGGGKQRWKALGCLTEANQFFKSLFFR
jgi:hypothetical protein